ncbi:hypothetical protein ABL78_5887 [Leptomonas seymouri]|uniref:Importin N-terminal domain-containing protein n=1 Tax=Leptomonas seymouri TaxID=5684 RepID=A0A0N0P4A0_LEPSE|nr:hypothetical protein ABL78_5887 [Leptomonas seymouri]|eukprot:KPI85049.1 hypothetical protein ABL78_5887 [Leptomonas seymouri]
MDSLFEVLRSSTDNNTRKAAAAQLRQLQSEQPDAFLQHTYEGIASPHLTPELRFFLCALVLAFLDESWHSGVSPASQERFTALYVELATSQPFPSLLLARKVGSIVALMARRGSRKAQVGGMPPLVQHVVTRYVAALESAARSQAYDRACCMLLMAHLLLKEMQGSRIGHVFEDVSQAMVAPISSVFALLPDAAAMLAHYDMCLYLLKCSLRTFGRAVFHPAFCCFLLDTTWRLAEGLGQDVANPAEAERRLRLLEYALKTTEATVVYFPGRLQELGSEFFFAETPTGGSDASAVAGMAEGMPSLSTAAASAAPPQSLFALLAAIIRSPVEAVVSEKAVCRALRLFTALLSAEDGDPFIAQCLHNFTASSSSFPPFLQHVITTYLADDTSPAALAAWLQQPERAAAELDVDMDDEASMMSCAEQLFLAFTGSTGCAACALGVTWVVVNQLLQNGEVSPITAALHAIGIGYYTMASEDNASYLGFLREKLLPLLQPDTLAQTSPFIARRVVWLVGMWCESVTDTRDRHAVLTVLEAVLQHAVHTHNVVLVLVSLKSTENFISDNNFTLPDMPPTLVTTVLQTIEMLLTAVRSPTTVKELAALVHVLTEKGAVQEHGEVLVQLFTPPAQAIIESYETQRAKANAAGSTGLRVGSDDDEAEDAEDSLGSLSMLLDCLGSSVRQCSSDTAIWSLFSTIVQPCTLPTRPATAWAEDNAWELFLTMVQSSHTFNLAAAAQALPVSLQHTHRDFGLLPLVFRVVYSLLLLRQDTVEGVVAAEDVDAWVGVVRDCPSSELCGAVTALLTTVARMSSGPLRVALLRHGVHALLTSADVQADQHTLPLALALALSVASACSTEEQQQLVAEVHAAAQMPGGPQATFSTLLEQLVLLLDVSPSVMVSRAVAQLLDTLSTVTPHSLSAEDRGMVQRALESVAMSVTASCTTLGAEHGADGLGEEAGEARSPQEMLLEWLGDEDVPSTSPHVARVMNVFAALLS